MTPWVALGAPPPMLVIALLLAALPAQDPERPLVQDTPQVEANQLETAAEGSPDSTGPRFGPGAAGGQRPQRPRWSVGLGTVIGTRPYAGGETRVTPIPVLSYQGERFTLEGPFARYKLGSWKEARFTALARYRFDGYDEGDGDMLDGMKREDTVDVGLRTTIPLGSGADLRIQALTDVLGRHEGVEVGASLGRTFRAGDWFIIPAVGVRWQSDNLASYYYGVRPDEARPGRPAFEVGDTTSFDIGLAARYRISKRTSLALVVRETFLGSEIRRSPIVDDNTVTSAVVSLTYSF